MFTCMNTITGFCYFAFTDYPYFLAFTVSSRLPPGFSSTNTGAHFNPLSLPARACIAALSNTSSLQIELVFALFSATSQSEPLITSPQPTNPHSDKCIDHTFFTVFCGIAVYLWLYVRVIIRKHQR